MKVNNTSYKVKKGDCMLIPSNTTHTLKNEGSKLLEFIVFGVALSNEGKTIDL